MANKTCVVRLKRELAALLKSPPPNIIALPHSSNILEWHYVIFGPKDTPYEGGEYHGKIVFPIEYPYKPPSIYMITPNGRFKPNVRLCLSMSDYHPELWNPLWSVSSILTGLLSFMLEDTATSGSIETGVAEKRRLAQASIDFNDKDSLFVSLFQQQLEEYRAKHKPPPEKPSNNKSQTSTVVYKMMNDTNNSLQGIVGLVGLVILLVLIFALVIAFVPKFAK